MRKLLSALALASAGCLVAGAAMAEPVKIALIETLSGGQAAVGKMFLSAVNYGLIRLNDEKAWPDGIKILEYDNQGGASEASDKVKAAINDGADIIIQGASSAIGGQITADVLKHNLRNPGKEVMYLNVGAEAMEFTGTKCHFYHFRWNGNAEIRLRAMLVAMKDANVLGKRVYDALARSDSQFTQNVAALNTWLQGHGGVPSDTVTQALQVDQPLLAKTVGAIMRAWYLGLVGEMPHVQVVAYESALMFDPVKDVLTIPSYCRDVPFYWSQKPAGA